MGVRATGIVPPAVSPATWRRWTVLVRELATQLVSDPLPINASGPLPTAMERCNGPWGPLRKLILPFELGKSTQAAPGAAGSARSPGELRIASGAPARAVRRSTGTSVWSTAHATQAVLPVASTAIATGVAPTATVATTARFPRSTIEIVLAAWLANTARRRSGVSADAVGPTPSLIGVPGFRVATSTGMTTPGWPLVPSLVPQTVGPPLP